MDSARADALLAAAIRLRDEMSERFKRFELPGGVIDRQVWIDFLVAINPDCVLDSEEEPEQLEMW